MFPPGYQQHFGAIVIQHFLVLKVLDYNSLEGYFKMLNNILYCFIEGL